MLKEILIDDNPLLLSSLGALIYEDKNEIVLQKNISITPPNIKETIDLAYKLANPICGGEIKDRIYDCAIFESSLGASGIGDVGLLTNIVEDYPIARNNSSASIAKKQVFNCDIVCCQKEDLDRYYRDIDHPKVNSFSLKCKNANLYVEDITYSLDETTMNIAYSNINTKNGELVSGNIEIKTFAPGPHHALNVLGVVATALSLNIDESRIIAGLENYKGIPGRTNKQIIGNSIIIEEINPGINTKAIEASINMLNNKSDYIISIGGDYGITCEEIDEDAVGELIDNLIENNKNLLFIYRSDYRKLSER